MARVSGKPWLMPAGSADTAPPSYSEWAQVDSKRWARDLVEIDRAKRGVLSLDTRCAGAIAPVTADETWRVQAVMARRGAAFIYMRNRDVNLRGFDLDTLRPGGWLTDMLIDAFMCYLQERVARLHGVDPCIQRVLCLPTLFYRKLVMGIKEIFRYEGVKNWTKSAKHPDRDDIFDGYGKIIMPINTHQTHWYVACINFDNRRFECYDSLRYPDAARCFPVRGRCCVVLLLPLF